MKASSAIAKGKLLEDYVADQIIAYGLDPKAMRSHGSGNGNREKADIYTSLTILGEAAGIECKNHKTISIPEWWRQAKKLESMGREPVLAFKLPGDPLEGTLVTIYLDTFLRLLAKTQFTGFDALSQPAPRTREERDRKVALEDLRRAVHRAIKHFPELEVQ